MTSDIIEDKLVGMVAPICFIGALGWYNEIPYSVLTTGILAGGCITIACFFTWVREKVYKTCYL